MVPPYLRARDVVVTGHVGGIDDERSRKKCRKVRKTFDDFKIAEQDSPISRNLRGMRVKH